MEKFEFLHKAKQLFEMRLSSPLDNKDEIVNGTYYKRGRYYEVKGYKYNKAQWRDNEKFNTSERYEVTTYDKNGQERGTDCFNRRRIRKRLGFIPGTHPSDQFKLDEEGLENFNRLKGEYLKAGTTQAEEKENIKAKITDVKSNRWGQRHVSLNGKKYLLDKFKGKFDATIDTPKGKRVPRVTIKGKEETQTAPHTGGSGDDFWNSPTTRKEQLPKPKFAPTTPGKLSLKESIKNFFTHKK